GSSSKTHLHENSTLAYPWNARRSLSMDAARNVAIGAIPPPANLMRQPVVAVALQQLLDRRRESGRGSGSGARARAIRVAYSVPRGPHDPIERAARPRHCNAPKQTLDHVPMIISFCMILRRQWVTPFEHLAALGGKFGSLRMQQVRRQRLRRRAQF